MISLMTTGPTSTAALGARQDPAGVGARSLAECIAIQAREADRYDPAMARLIDDRDARAGMGSLAKAQAIREFDIERVVGEIANLYVRIHDSERKQTRTH